MFSIDEGNYLLKAPKFICDDNIKLTEYSMMGTMPLKFKLLLKSEDEEFEFLYDINQSNKNHLKISLYLMEYGIKYGLMRIDYNGIHKNPDIIIDGLPEIFHQYAGKWFKYEESHIHLITSGYSGELDWAIPLSEYGCKTCQINSQRDIFSAILQFNELINLQTRFKYAESLI